jgi:hypothetical protein
VSGATGYYLIWTRINLSYLGISMYDIVWKMILAQTYCVHDYQRTEVIPSLGPPARTIAFAIPAAPRYTSTHMSAQPSPLRSVSALASSAAPCDRTCFLRQGKICARIRRVCSGTRVWYDGELRPIAQKFKTACLLRLGGLTNWWMGVRSSAANCGFVSAGRSDADPRWTECAKLCGKGC